jgi:hypothetical protein
MSSSTYFSIDYRSPPSGLGQIIKPGEPEVVDGKYNMTLVSYSGCGIDDDPSYTKTFHIESEYADQYGCLGPQDLETLYDILITQGVEYVYDSEMSYDYPEHFDEDQHIPLSDWFNLVKDQL